MAVATLSNAAGSCDTSGFERVASGWIRITRDMIDFRASASEVRDQDLSRTASMDPVFVRQRAQDAIRRTYADMVRPPTPTASLLYRGLQSTAVVCDGALTFDYRIPISGLAWQVDNEDGNADLLPPVRQLLRDHGFVN
jgi:hypothetical protein